MTGKILNFLPEDVFCCGIQAFILDQPQQKIAPQNRGVLGCRIPRLPSRVKRTVIFYIRWIGSMELMTGILTNGSI
jgi:hypothetical protein